MVSQDRLLVSNNLPLSPDFDDPRWLKWFSTLNSFSSPLLPPSLLSLPASPTRVLRAHHQGALVLFLLALVSRLASSAASNLPQTKSAVPCAYSLPLSEDSQPHTCNIYRLFSTDPTCVCVNDQFKAEATACLQANCTAQEITTAENLQQMECAASTCFSGAASVLQNRGFLFSLNELFLIYFSCPKWRVFSFWCSLYGRRRLRCSFFWCSSL